ncbi:MAG: hypothetical protein QXF43_04835 [Nitrososphaerales archaeon]
MKPREHICMFKGTVIKGWSGVYVLEGSPDLILLYISKSYGTGSPPFPRFAGIFG